MKAQYYIAVEGTKQLVEITQEIADLLILEYVKKENPYAPDEQPQYEQAHDSVMDEIYMDLMDEGAADLGHCRIIRYENTAL